MLLSDFGRTVKVRLMDIGQSQKWLAEKVSDETGLYFDTSYLHKVMVGKSKNPKICAAIKEVLQIDAPAVDELLKED